jgi:hypothetical protein
VLGLTARIEQRVQPQTQQLQVDESARLTSSGFGECKSGPAFIIKSTGQIQERIINFELKPESQWHQKNANVYLFL